MDLIKVIKSSARDTFYKPKLHTEGKATMDEALRSDIIKKASKDAAARSADPRTKPGATPAWLTQAIKDKAKKTTPVKISTDRDIGYKVVDVGPGQKETVRKQHNWKEEVELDEGGMPASIIKHKQKISQMDDREFAEKYKDRSDAELRSMAWRHGHGGPGKPGHDYYVNRRKRGMAANEEVNLEEAVTVKTSKHSWGKMVTVHHGSSHSFPLHPEHQEKIAKLGDGESTSFTDETNSKVTAHRDGDTIHLSLRGSNTKTPVARHHFTEELVLGEAKRGRPKKGSISGGEEEGGREHIIVQLRKAENLRGERHTEFNDSSKHKLPLEHVKKALDMHTKMKPIQKGEFEARLAKSHKSFHDAISGKPAEPARPKVSLAKSVREDRVADVQPQKASTRMINGVPTIVKYTPAKKQIKIENIHIEDEEILNKLYENLSEENRVIFEEMVTTTDGMENLISFAIDQGF